MSTTELMDMIDKLPDDKKKEVEKLVFSLSGQFKPGGLLIFNPITDDQGPKLKREFGVLKGRLTQIADDFDSHLEDFKDYL